MFMEISQYRLDAKTREYKVRLEEYIENECVSKQRLARLCEIHSVTLERILKGYRVKPITLLRVGKFLNSLEVK